MTFSSNPSIGMMQLNPVMQPCKCFSNPRCSFQTIDSSERSESCPASHFDHIGPSTACEHGWSAHLTMALQIIGRSATMRMATPCARIMASSCGSQNPVESSAKSCFADVDTMDTSRFVSPKSFPRRCLDWHLWHLSGEA